MQKLAAVRPPVGSSGNIPDDVQVIYHHPPIRIVSLGPVLKKDDVVRGHISVCGATAAEQKSVFRHTHQYEVERSVGEIVGGPPPRRRIIDASQKVGQSRTKKIPPYRIVGLRGN